MFRRATRIALCTLCALVPVAGAAEVSKSEFFAQSKDYIDAFQAAATDLQGLIQTEKFKVVAVAEFTDINGDPLHIGRIYAEELSTMLVAPLKLVDGKKASGTKYRVMDPAAIEEFVRAGGGASLWSSTKKIRAFGNDSDVNLVVTGKIEVSNREARFYLKAVETDEASIVWARTISVPGFAAGTEVAAAALPAPAPVLEPQPLATEPAAEKTAAPAPAADAGAPGVAAATAAVGTAAAVVGPTITAVVGGAAAVVGGTAAVIGAANSSAAPSSAAPSSAAPSSAAPSSTTAPPVVPTAAAAAAAVPAASSPAPANPPSAAPAAAVPGVAALFNTAPPEVANFENAWLRVRIRSASKYEGSGWVTVVLDVSNLSDRPMYIDFAQADPGRGIDESGNAWRIERVSGLRLAPNANAGMTALGSHSMLSVVLVLATSAQSSGKRLSFGPNLFWFGSASAGDSGRLTLAFSNVRVD